MNRFITKGICEKIPLSIQIYLWSLLDNLKEKDYLQVFDISPIDDGVKIVHSQEVPEYKKEYLVSDTLSFYGKIFIIDDITHKTMLLAEEY